MGLISRVSSRTYRNMTHRDRQTKELLSRIAAATEDQVILLVTHGSFNPVHNDHVNMMTESKRLIEGRVANNNSDSVLVLGVVGITCQSWLEHKGLDENNCFTDQERTEMLLLAQEDHPWLYVANEGPTVYSSGQLGKLLLDKLQKITDKTVTLIKVQGSDLVWRHGRRKGQFVNGLPREIVVERTDNANTDATRVKYNEKYSSLSGVTFGLSSTKVRNALLNTNDMTFLGT